MKLKEKLAEHFAYKSTGNSPFPNTEAEKLWYFENGGFKKGFIKGFEKAREMAISALYNDGLDPTGWNEQLIRELGEEEVDET